MRFTPKKSHLLFKAANLMLLAGATSLHAADALVIEEVIVTAQKRMETTQETPVSITALGTADIERRGIANVSDLMASIPSVGGYESPGSRGNVGISMRGVSSGSPANLSIDPANAIYLDNVYVGKNIGAALDVAEIERIEVLRGPQGTLYGRNSTGGAINFITKRPQGELAGKVTLTAGNYDLMGAKVNVDLPAFGTAGEGLGEVLVGLGYQTRDRDALYENVDPSRDGFSDIDRQAWRLAIDWHITDDLSVAYTYDHSELDELSELQQMVGMTALTYPGYNANVVNSNQRVQALGYYLQQAGLGAGGIYANALTDPNFARFSQSLASTYGQLSTLNTSGSRPSKGQSDQETRTASDVDGHALAISWNLGEVGFLGDVELKSITAQRDLESDAYGELDGIDNTNAPNDLILHTLHSIYSAYTGNAFVDSNFIAPNANKIWNGIDTLNALYPQYSGGAYTNSDAHNEYSQFSQELQVIGSTERLDYVVGAYFFDDESSYSSVRAYAAPLSGISTVAYEGTTEAWALYSQATYRPAFNEDLSFTAGLRYTEEEKDVTYQYLTDGGLFTNPAWTGVMTPDANYGKTRKESFDNVSGTFTVAYDLSDEANVFLRYATGYRSGGFNGEQYNSLFDEETIEQLEVGIKSDWLDRRLRVNASLFTYNYEDMQVSQILSSPSGTTSNIVNAGEASRWGGEVEITALPTENLLVTLAYSYINGDFDKYPELCDANGANCVANTEDLAKRAQAAGNQVTFGMDYELMRNDFGALNFHMDVNWQEATYSSAFWTGTYDTDPNPAVNPYTPVGFEPIKLDARTLVNARLTLSEVNLGDGALEVALWGKNLLDDDYPTFGINFAGLGPVTEQYGEPRTYGADLTYRF